MCVACMACHYNWFHIVFHFYIYFRYKDRYFPEDLKPTVRDLFRDVVTAHCHTELPSTSSVEVPGSSRSTDKSPPACSLQAMFAELVEEDTGQTDEEITIVSQINQYLAEAVMPRSGQPLAYWQANKGRFPALAQAARAYLCSLCTSVDSERLFSTAANVIDDKRNRLTSKNAEMLIVIKRNLPFMIETWRILYSVLVGRGPACFGLKHFVAICLILIY